MPIGATGVAAGNADTPVSVRVEARAKPARRGTRGLLCALVAALACGPIDRPAGTDAPMNACPEYPCESYLQAGAVPLCNAGQCVANAAGSSLWVTVSLSQNSPFAAARTFIAPLDDLLSSPPPAGFPVGACPPPIRCAWLPGIADVTGAFQAKPSDAQAVGWNLGNLAPSLTWLPAQATYRPLQTPAGGDPPVDAASLGLPVDAVASGVAQATGVGTLQPGPNGGPSMVFREVNLPPGKYERTIMPLPPLDRAFPPDVAVVDVAGGVQTTVVDLSLDKTISPSGNQVLPTFDITRDEGLGGWIAYLRDATTLRRISNTVSLSGVTVSGVQLATDHHSGDALTGAQLVVAPPAGQPIPTYVASPIAKAIAPSEPYPLLPPPVSIAGSVSSIDGAAIRAELLFEATGIYRMRQGHGAVLDATDFEFATRVAANPDASGRSTYSVALPQGEYRLSIRPLDDAASVTTLAGFIVAQPNPPAGEAPSSDPNVTASPRRLVQGSATITDGRRLGGAIVQAQPSACPDDTVSSSCMPRAAQTTTSPDGSFAFGAGLTPGLDPGVYVLRVQPAAGTRLPWVWQPLAVGSSPVLVPPIAVPAPTYLALRLYDPASNPVVNAVVRLFAFPAHGVAIEVARAFTGTDGACDVYLAPAKASP